MMEMMRMRMIKRKISIPLHNKLIRRFLSIVKRMELISSRPNKIGCLTCTLPRPRSHQSHRPRPVQLSPTLMCRWLWKMIRAFRWRRKLNKLKIMTWYSRRRIIELLVRSLSRRLNRTRSLRKSRELLITPKNSLRGATEVCCLQSKVRRVTRCWATKPIPRTRASARTTTIDSQCSLLSERNVML